MILYPAIDLINGECVRLAQGRFDAVTRYDSDPFKRLNMFNEEFAKWVHIAAAAPADRPPGQGVASQNPDWRRRAFPRTRPNPSR
jgi:phosphoribosylformimino-5-aminoimidazole carboxamide ribonucleotide (ProFAR) isomerase